MLIEDLTPERRKLLEYMMQIARLNPSTIEVYDRFYRSFAMFMELRGGINQQNIEDYVQSHNNAQVCRSFVNLYLKFTKLHKKYDLPPKSTGRKPQRVRQPVTDKEIELMGDYIISNFKPSAYIYYRIAVEGGLRRGEGETISINSFMWDIWVEDKSKPCKLIIKGKGYKERTVLISAYTMNLIVDVYLKKLYQYETDKELAWVLTQEQQLLPMSEKGFYRMIIIASKKVIGRRITPHDIRRYRATWLHKRGVPLTNIRVYLGHEKIDTTQLYILEDVDKTLSMISDLM